VTSQLECTYDYDHVKEHLVASKEHIFCYNLKYVLEIFRKLVYLHTFEWKQLCKLLYLRIEYILYSGRNKGQKWVCCF